MSTARSDDDLARTATEVVSGEAGVPTAAVTIEGSLGRYRLERELGSGGMGVVHAAFDPDLERRVALKVLRSAEGGMDSRARLLREARAMARLTHPNVVTVYEVGSTAGRDFVAMELIDGDTLAEWVRGRGRSPREVIDAFVAAGRGLAAAHAAGVIHRDFKPHNVLRARDGRILVTDFGLARAADAEAIDPMATTLASAASAAASTTSSPPSSMSGLTRTGSVLGTPAYMAPEQWTGAGVGPASDQFAFCVALWEALTGERPYRGTTLDALRTEVERGPAALDDSRLPRRIRPILRRGLDPDPDRRWRTMNALLAALARAERGPGRWLAGIGGVLVAAGIAIAFVVQHGQHAAIVDGPPPCPMPARGPAEIWPASLRATIATAHAEVAAVIDADVASWTARHRAVCAAPTPAAAQLTCLDGVMQRLDAIVRAIGAAHGSIDATAIAALLVDPTMCELASPPRLALAPTPDVIAALGLSLDQPPAHGEPPAIAALLDAPAQPLGPCAHELALAARARTTLPTPLRRAAATDAVEDAERCGDDRQRATALIAAASFELGLPQIGAKGEAALRRAATAVERIPQRDLTAHVAIQRAIVEGQQSHWSAAIKLVEQAAADFGARGRVRDQVRTIVMALSDRLTRAEAGDLDAIHAGVAQWRPIAARLGDADSVRSLRLLDATVTFVRGDVQAAHAELVAVAAEHRDSDDQPAVAQRTVDGDVVDAAGKPVDGAMVAVGSPLYGDSISIVLEGGGDRNHTTTTDARGHFALTFDAELRLPVIAAQLATRRSAPQLVAAHQRLVLVPTTRLEGRVALGGHRADQTRVVERPPNLPLGSTALVAPVAADGTFAIDGVVPGEIMLGAETVSLDTGNTLFTTLTARLPKTAGIELSLASSTRTLDVIVRSTASAPLEGAQVLVMPGNVKIHAVAELEKLRMTGLAATFARPLVGEAPAATRGQAHTGDLIAHFGDLQAGELTACAIAVAGDLSDPEVVRKMQAQLDKLELRCVPVGDRQLLVIESPPMRRLD